MCGRVQQTQMDEYTRRRCFRLLVGVARFRKKYGGSPVIAVFSPDSAIVIADDSLDGGKTDTAAEGNPLAYAKASWLSLASIGNAKLVPAWKV